MDETRIKKGLAKWADLLDHAIAEWAIGQWMTDLAAADVDDDELLAHMKYMIDLKRPPNLEVLKASIAHGLPSSYLTYTIPDKQREDFVTYMSMLGEAFSCHENKDKWLKIREAQEFGKAAAPHAEWTDVISECEKEIAKYDEA